MAERFVTISRRWNNPQITIDIGTDGISLRMSMEDFKVAILEEMKSSMVVNSEILKQDLAKDIGSVTFIVRDKTFQDRLGTSVDRVMRTYGSGEFNARLLRAIDKVILGIKDESVKVAQHIKE